MPLAEKIGPLPVYAYVGIGVLGVLIYHRYHSASGASNAVSDTADTSGDSSLAYGGTTSGTGTVNIPGQYSAPVPDSVSYASNQEWAIGAADYLTGLGNSPQDVNAAINSYVSGQPLITSARNLVSQAIEHLGNAPDGPINLISAVPAPPVTAPTPPKAPAVAVKKPTAQQIAANKAHATHVANMKAHPGKYGPLPSRSVPKGEKVRPIPNLTTTDIGGIG